MFNRIMRKLFDARDDEFVSDDLRNRFRNDGIDVGMYSYGCFDLKRIQKNTKIGRYCSFAETARIYTRDRSISYIGLTPYFFNSTLGAVDSDKIEQGSIVVEDDVWVGHNAVILPQAKRIGRGAVIGAGAVITKPVEPYSIMVGNPARAIRKRFSDDVIEKIERSRWWELDHLQIKDLIAKDPEWVYQLPVPA